MRRPERTDGYAPIADYGVIGNLRTAALVALDGSIDWCCMPELDSPSVLGALLDAGRGGRFSIRPAEPFEVEQRYVSDTNVLETSFRTPGGQVTVTDFMPLRGSIVRCDDPETQPEIHRIVHGDGGSVVLDIEWSPRFGYAVEPTSITAVDGGFAACLGPEQAALGGVPESAELETGRAGAVVRARVTIEAGTRRAFVMRFGTTDATHSIEASDRALGETIGAWRSWVAVPTADRSWLQDCAPHVIRSELVLKLLTHPKTGAIAAAATTSLPETIGGVRNWDYRFSWIRDSAFTVQALMAVGHRAEALDFLAYAERAAMSRDDRWGLQIMYGLRGEADLPERELTHLEGYRGSRPVRIGNAAARQRQHDIYGELMGAAHQFILSGGVLEPDLLSFLSRIADQASVAWPTPDDGIWEARREQRHYVYSKVMCWSALDRAIRLTMRSAMRGNVARWTRERDAIHRHVLEHGVNPTLGAFVQAYGSGALDAANLLIPVMEFLPADDPRVQRTIDLTLEHLVDQGMVYRYLTDDGLPGSEGAFGLCTYWLIDALALSGRLDEAWELFAGMSGRANHLGLYSEEIDPRSGAFLGNFPQAFTHIGLINSVLYLARAEGRGPLRAAQPLGAGVDQRSAAAGSPVRR